MALLRDLHYAGNIDTYVPFPVEAVDALGAKREAQYLQNRQAKDELELGLAKLRVRDVNQPIVDQFTGEANQRIQQIVDAGAYETAGPEIRRIAMDIAQNPTLKAAMSDKEQYDAYITQLDERFKKGEIGADRYAAARKMALTTNQAPVEIDPQSGVARNVFTGYQPVKTADITKKASEFISKIKGSKQSVQMGTTKDGQPIYMAHDPSTQQYLITGKQEGVGEAEAMQLVSSFLSSDPEISAYIDEGLKFDKFNKFYDTALGEYREPTTADIREVNPLVDQEAASLGINLDELDPQTISTLYDGYYKEKQIGQVAAPYAGAASYDSVEFDYHKDDAYLARLRSGLDLNNRLKTIATQEAADKRTHKYKEELKKVEEQKEANRLVLPVNIPAESFYDPQATNKSKEAINQRLADIERLRMLGINIGEGMVHEEIDLKNKLITEDAQQRLYMEAAVANPKGRKYVDDSWNNYIKSNPSPIITKSEFESKVLSGNVDKPQFSSMAERRKYEKGGSKEPDAYIYDAYFKITNNRDLKVDVNTVLVPEAKGLTSIYAGTVVGEDAKDIMKNKDASYVDVVSSTVTNQIISGSGVGYTVLGTGLELDETLVKKGIYKQEDDDDGAVKKGRYRFYAQPLDRAQAVKDAQGNLNDEIMYNLIITDTKTGKEVFQGKVRPNDQASHNEAFYSMNENIIKANPDTEVGRRAEISNARIRYPQFNLRNQEVLLGEVKDTDEPGKKAFGTIINVPNKGKYVYKAENVYVDAGETDGLMPRKEKQKVYQFVKLKDEAPLGLKITSENIDKYLYFDKVGVDGNVQIKEQYMADPSLIPALSNPKEATYFKSTQDILLTYSRINK